jgi:hypothetical protein
MKLRRTSFRFLVVGLALLSFYPVGTYLAESYYESTNPISFGLDFGRPVNHWDYAWIAALVLAATFFLVSFWFFRKDD